ncbi:MAG: hypothetical protein ABIO83_04225 [Ilumatobacteraceae bacterium]
MSDIAVNDPQAPAPNHTRSVFGAPIASVLTDMPAPGLPMPGLLTPGAPVLPGRTDPQVHMPAAPALPVGAIGLPTLPDVRPAANTAPVEVADPNAAPAEPGSAPEHPMAHLMPSKSKRNEASRKAAEIRAAQRAKARRTKWSIIAAMLVFTALVGPPTGKWLIDAINEAGSTSTVDEPAG